MAQGGKRAGAGRKKGYAAIQAEALKKYLVQEIIKAKAPLVAALIFEAKNGNVPALKEVFERGLGKVPNVLEAGTDDELALPFSIVIKRKDETA